MNAEQVARGLGWFSVGLGTLEVVAPGSLIRFLGVQEERTSVVRAYGLRELVAGVGLLTQPAAATTWVWARVAGDVLDIATLGSATTGDPTARKRTGNTLAMLTAITVVDVLVARALTLERAEPPTLAERLLGRGKRG
ncbi:hypothetical protein DAERI_010212 [Deinococcus aerius]|uniref:Uncharacterized protein n=1 Tax=Deinococcus aerius TaxID=200253 RepID=A0A2I9D1W0_9DEIO|nr:hypothetical protein [Deinococcus aerius]GBF04040.1 hypothetical protein DAERI_010212 [Deinococcus aerius]